MSNSVVTLSSFNLLFFTQVLTVLTSTIKYNEYVTDKGKNISIPCIADGFNIMWVKENGNYSTIVQTGEYLVLTNVTTSDNGVYVCFAAISPRRTISAATSHGGELINVIDDAVMMTHAGDRMNLSSTPPPSSSVVGNNASFEIDLHNNKTKTKTTTTTTTTNASTTSTLPMPKANATETNVLWETSTSISSKSSASSSSSYDFNYLPPTLTTSHPTTPAEVIEQEFQAFHKINISIRTAPGPVTQLYFKASTILGFLVWRFNKSNSGGYPVRSFTAEYRNVSYKETPFNSSFEHEWIRMDPINIAPNVRQMEVYRLEPNTTYEFRIWANNQLGSGEIVTTNVTTLPETKEEDLIRLIQPDLDNFDPRIWIVAVSIVLGTLVILAIGLCIVLSKECYQSSRQEFQDGWDGIELIPNIILNPGFRETDSEGGPNDAPYLRTIIFKDNNQDDTDDSCDSESDHEPRMERFKRKLSVFFTDPTIRRI